MTTRGLVRPPDPRRRVSRKMAGFGASPGKETGAGRRITTRKWPRNRGVFSGFSTNCFSKSPLTDARFGGPPMAKNSHFGAPKGSTVKANLINLGPLLENRQLRIFKIPKFLKNFGIFGKLGNRGFY